MPSPRPSTPKALKKKKKSRPSITLLTGAALLLICMLSIIVSDMRFTGQSQGYGSFKARQMEQQTMRPSMNKNQEHHRPFEASQHKAQTKSQSNKSLKEEQSSQKVDSQHQMQNTSTREENPKFSSLAGLSCQDHGGPQDKDAQEMIYWNDIPRDSTHTSPFHSKGEARYLTFEPDQGGFNNIRMAMETVIALAASMGRTLVLPPAQRIYLLDAQENNKAPNLLFANFYDMLAIHNEHRGLNIISMEEFLKLQLKNERPLVSLPGNRTNWDGSAEELYAHLQEQTRVVETWDPDDCIAYFPDAANKMNPHEYQEMYRRVRRDFPTRWRHYLGKPTRHDASVEERLAEFSAGRSRLCIYGPKMQQQPILHFPTELLNNENKGTNQNPRLLVHFYAFLFFEDIKLDLWTKRFVRDHLRYADEIQCASARVVAAMRERVRTVHGRGDGMFHSMHIRRGDFQYKMTRVSAEEIYNATKEIFKEGDVVYVATDERDKSFFAPLKQHYVLYFLDDFVESGVVDGHGQHVSPNRYGMLDQLVASRGDIFIGCFFSTFTGYINRLRGYHAIASKQPGSESGKILKSFYYAPEDLRLQLHQYVPIKQPLWAEEFATAWLDIDRDIKDGTLSSTTKHTR